MSQAAVIQLVKSLSKDEKRHFKLSSKKQAGSKDYLVLFDIIDQNTFIDTLSLREKFEVSQPGSSLENTSRYLLKVLTDCLIQTKIKDDNLFQLLYGYLRIKILNERSLPQEGFKELKKLQQTAISSQNSFIQYLIYRFELNYFSDQNFTGISEQQLVGIQMRMRDILKDMHNINEHYALYELLKFRLVHSGKILSEDSKKKLNDLVLSEMGLITRRVKNNIESQKLHLLFQSFFLIDIGDYPSALKIFYELNRLFEQNHSLWGYPPMDYLTSLDGILDTLRTVRYYKEMAYYINKMELLDKKEYPEYFRFIVKKNIIIYEVTILIGTGKFKNAINFIQKIDPILINPQSMVDFEKHSELLFCIALIYYKLRDFKKAQKNINQIVLIGKLNYQSVIYKVARLLGILMSYEDKNFEYLDYEIRSYKRTFQNKGKLLKTERIFFKIIKINPDLQNFKQKGLVWKKIASTVNEIENDKFEMQLLKYFNFITWIKDRLKIN